MPVGIRTDSWKRDSRLRGFLRTQLVPVLSLLRCGPRKGPLDDVFQRGTKGFLPTPRGAGLLLEGPPSAVSSSSFVLVSFAGFFGGKVSCSVLGVAWRSR